MVICSTIQHLTMEIPVVEILVVEILVVGIERDLTLDQYSKSDQEFCDRI